MTAKVQQTGFELPVLEWLDEHTDTSDWFAFTRTVVDGTKLTEKDVRGSLRALTAAEFVSRQAVFDDEGRLAGTGYAITRRGRASLRRLRPAPSDSNQEVGE